MLDIFYDNEDEVQIGIDEVGRGCFAGPVVAAGVIWNVDWVQKQIDKPDSNYKLLECIKDSKKLSEKNRNKLSEFIISNAEGYATCFIDPSCIDEINILNATYKAMHGAIQQCIDKTQLPIDRIIVDGTHFKPFINRNSHQEDQFIIPHSCVTQGDMKYLNIASASIIAKVARDKYMKELCEDEPLFQTYYDWVNNKGYGTKKHIEGIKKWGLTVHHRKTFGMCKNY